MSRAMAKLALGLSLAMTGPAVQAEQQPAPLKQDEGEVVGQQVFKVAPDGSDLIPSSVREELSASLESDYDEDARRVVVTVFNPDAPVELKKRYRKALTEVVADAGYTPDELYLKFIPSEDSSGYAAYRSLTKPDPMTFTVEAGQIKDNVSRLASAAGYEEVVWAGDTKCLDWEVINTFDITGYSKASLLSQTIEGYPLTARMHTKNNVIEMKLANGVTQSCDK